MLPLPYLDARGFSAFLFVTYSLSVSVLFRLKTYRSQGRHPRCVASGEHLLRSLCVLTKGLHDTWLPERSQGVPLSFLPQSTGYAGRLDYFPHPLWAPYTTISSVLWVHASFQAKTGFFLKFISLLKIKHFLVVKILGRSRKMHRRKYYCP